MRTATGSPPSSSGHLLPAGPADLEQLGQAALRFVTPGQTLGLGTGRAASAFIRALGHSGIAVRGVATSRASADLARALGLELVELNAIRRVDIDFDGADEVDPRLNLIKGLGGALVREKIVAAAAARRIFLVGQEKLVRRLGAHGNLPVEVVPFAAEFARRRIGELGLRAQIRLNDRAAEFSTDNGNLILDCRVASIRNPARLERELRAIPGVLGTGLFVGMSDLVMVAAPGGSVTTLRPGRRAARLRCALP